MALKRLLPWALSASVLVGAAVVLFGHRDAGMEMDGNEPVLDEEPKRATDESAAGVPELRARRVLLDGGSVEDVESAEPEHAHGVPRDSWRHIVEAKSSGKLSPEELMSSVKLCQVEANTFERQRAAMTVDPSQPRTAVAAAQMYLAEQSAIAKGQALLDGSYILLTPNESPPHALTSHPDLHLISCFGGKRNGTDYITWVVIDLRKYPAMARAMENYRAARADQRRSKLQDFVSRINALGEAQRAKMAEGAPDLMPGLQSLRAEFLKLGGRFDGLVATSR